MLVPASMRDNDDSKLQVIWRLSAGAAFVPGMRSGRLLFRLQAAALLYAACTALVQAQTFRYLTVSSVPQLKAAVSSDVAHIIISAHLDLSSEAGNADSRWLLSLQNVRSIRVSHSTFLACSCGACTQLHRRARSGLVA